MASVVALGAGQREPALREVIARLGAYVTGYGEQASLFVGTETYRQDSTGDASVAAQHRTLISEFAIVRTEGFRDSSLGKWVGFRDVVEVDGRAVSDHRDRLTRLLTEHPGSYDEPQRLSDESGRFNIGGIARDFNVPTAALFFFQTRNLDRFKFKRRGTASMAGTAVWEIEFEETYHPTLIRMPTGESLPSRGRIRVDPATGIVVETHLETQGFSYAKRSQSSATIDVTYARVPDLGTWLPQTMTETYTGSIGSTWERVTGTATYTHYRKFDTSVRIKP